MNKEELINEIVDLEISADFIRNNALIGTFIRVNKYGVGKVLEQNEFIARVLFDNKEIIFDASDINEKYYDGTVLHDIEKEIKQKRILLYNGKSPEELIKELISNWSSWDKYEDDYLNKIAYEMVKFPDTNTTKTEALILEELKGKLSENDWNKLPNYIADIHFGRKLKFTDGYDKAKITNRIRKKHFNDAKKKTILIINKLIEFYEYRYVKDTMIDRLHKFFNEDYFGASAAYLNSDISNIIDEDDFELESTQFVQSWFEKNSCLNENLPDSEQIKAISTRNKNVEVVARAGSGKTTTIVSRVQFLVEHCGVAPSAIMLLAFNRKAVEEIEDRLTKVLGKDKLPFVMTFHALAYLIVHPKQELIYDNPETEDGTLSRVVQTLIDNRIRDEKCVDRIKKIMLSQFKDEWIEIERGGYNLSKDEMIVFRKAINKRTMSGEPVQSDFDKRLANLLFEHDVPYKYIVLNNSGNSNSAAYFKIDSHINRSIIILTSEVIDLNNKELNKKRYYWKRENAIQYYRIQPNLVDNDDAKLTEILKNIFFTEGIPFDRLSDEEIWLRIRDRAIGLFTDSVKSFIGRCRKLEIDSLSLALMIGKHKTITAAEKWFLDIVQELYKDYLDELEKQNYEDFDGLMSIASTYVCEGRHKFKKNGIDGNLEELEHILIDEYQDFSYLFDKFLANIRKTCPNANIFCVGDDWQAINGFAGSDIKYFTSFVDRYEDSRRYHLLTNYRSIPNIVRSSNALMACFDDNTLVKAARTGDQKIWIGYYKDLKLIPNEERLFGRKPYIAALLRLVYYFVSAGKSIGILSRTNKEIEGLEKYLKYFFRSDVEKQRLISVSTTHKYKGKQEDAILVLDADIGKYPLINPTWIFNRVFGDTEKKIIDDERRLFYVAITRAKDNLVLLTTHNQESPFIKDIPQMSLISWDDIPPIEDSLVGNELRYVKVIVTNPPGINAYPYPTVRIKEYLKKAKFAYDGNGGWYKFYELIDNLDERLLKETWAINAKGVQVIIVKEDNSIITNFMI